ncbi:HAD family hydrolase [Candidatus Nomurabacteria bacterium]|nr:HAD family hydrolase [Candidatus Nomurabacteria bacterium]
MTSEQGKTVSDFSPDKIKVLVFDVDDTITRGTLEIKVKVFEKLFPNKLDRLQEGRELYEFTGKGDRYNIIAHILEKPQKGCRDEREVQLYANKFETMTQSAIRSQGIHPDDLDLLVSVKNNFSGPVYLLSATPENSVSSNIKYFESIYPELFEMFTRVIGSPMEGGKAGELAKIAAANNVSIDEVAMVGDGGSDYNGAKDSGSQFIGILAGKKNNWEGESFPKVKYLSDIRSFIGL